MLSLVFTCSCGDPALHRVGRARTADGVTIVLWSDGDVTDRLGGGFPGLGRPRANHEAALQGGWAVLRDASLYEAAELPSVVKAARRAALGASAP